MVVLWVMSAVGLLVVAPVVVALASYVIRPALESARYADDILVHGVRTINIRSPTGVRKIESFKSVTTTFSFLCFFG